ncbi:FKBP-type peptidyl-prolyl cis-trans isomerase [Photobacterium sp. SDRW27]|uniref:FKBP-type peptidyl-prolyl cis-trans isomerase n=1 Tax=Photobacterium obscurum TaxID=2829490 RepID=UPI00224471FA|nr:FKBP-type peptidyl-prolyl cis-trans isomerase [Photobacterium obscurum]MCW8329112.1 FKBP-type peptidyl-prolyl cis-trans isomerase [Photobacterium obscurum]
MKDIKPISLETNEQKVSYGMGWQFGRHLLTHNFDGLDMEAAFAGVLDSFNEKEAPLTEQEVETAFKTIAARVEVARQKEAAELAGQSQSFMAENALKPGIITTDSGLQYKVVEMGEGRQAGLVDNVIVHYHGMLITGDVFDSSYERGEPAEFPIQSVIPGWTEVLQMMPEGSKWRVYVPAELAYGEMGKPPKIPGNAALIFDIELIQVV